MREPTGQPTRHAGPRVPDVGVLALVQDHWSGQWNSRHHVLSRLARHFHVLWVNPAHEWRERPRTPAAAALAGAPGFDVYTAERWLPKLYRPRWLADAALRARLASARRRLVARGCRRIVLYLWQPSFGPALDLVPHELSCYHIDDEYSFSTEPQPLDPSEVAVIRRVGQVFIHSPGLFERKGQLNPHTALVPNGVDYAAFATPTPEPADLAAVPHPRIGYAGWIKNQLDWPLLTELAMRHPEWSFVFVGGVNRHPEVVPYLELLGRRDNVRFLGAKSTAELATYPQHFDACVMPYAMNAYTDSIYPLKLHEYLASGRPVIGVPIRSLRSFSNVIALASGAEAWSAAIAAALDEGSVGREARQAVAREHDWSRLVATIAHTMSERLESSDAARRGSQLAGAGTS